MSWVSSGLGLLFLATSLSPVHAQQSDKFIEVIAAELAGRLDDDPKSGYNAVLKAILPADNYNFQFQRYPATRALRDFLVKQRACFFPASTYSVAAVRQDELIQTDAIDYVSAHFVTAPHKSLVKTAEHIKGRKVAMQWALDSDYFIQIDADFELLRTPDDLTALRMLYADRIDAMFGWFPDTFIIAEQNGLPLPHFDPSLILFQLTTHVVCKKFEGAEQLISEIDIQIKALKKGKKLRAMLGRHARIVGEDVPVDIDEKLYITPPNSPSQNEP